MANVRKGLAEPEKNEAKQEFAQTSVTNFRKKMMEEEIQEMKQPVKQNDDELKAISYGMLPAIDQKVDRS